MLGNTIFAVGERGGAQVPGCGAGDWKMVDPRSTEMDREGKGAGITLKVAGGLQVLFYSPSL